MPAETNVEPTTQDTLLPLTAENVDKVLFDCLPDDKLEPENTIDVAGVMTRITFDRRQIEKHRPQIVAYLEQLPTNFRKRPPGGGGWSFLNMLDDVDGNQWADEHRSMDKLVCLGIAIDMVSLSSSDIRQLLPGGMPYVFIHL